MQLRLSASLEAHSASSKTTGRNQSAAAGPVAHRAHAVEAGCETLASTQVDGVALAHSQVGARRGIPESVGHVEARLGQLHHLRAHV